MAKLPILPYARKSITEGLSANRAYRNYRAAAGELGERGVRRQDFLRIYSETLAARERDVAGMDRPKNTVPSADEIQTRTGVRARGYYTWVSIYQRTKGQDDLIHTPFAIRSNQPITPAEAEQRAMWWLENEEPDVYNRMTLGVTYTHTDFFRSPDE